MERDARAPAAARRGTADARAALRAAARAAAAGRHATAHRHQPDGGTMARGHPAMTDDIGAEWLDDLRVRIHLLIAGSALGSPVLSFSGPRRLFVRSRYLMVDRDTRRPQAGQQYG